MKRILILLVLSLLLCYSCEDSQFEQTGTNKGEKFTANFNLHKGKIVVKSTDIAGAGSMITADDLIGIEVCKNDDSKTLIASGLFTGEELSAGNLSVALEHGEEYVVESTLYIGGKARLSGGTYANPPFVKDVSTAISQVADWELRTNLSLGKFKNLKGVSGTLDNSSTDIYYCCNTFIANCATPGIALELRRVSCSIVPIVYNVADGYYISGTISYAGGTASSTINAEGTGRIYSNSYTESLTFTADGETITANVYKEERFMPVVDVNAQYVSEDNSKEILIDLYLKSNNGGIMRRLQAVVKPKFNKRYKVYIEGSLEASKYIEIVM